jgi:undecaprenyl-diphosphatase
MQTTTWLGSQIVVLALAASAALTMLVLHRDRGCWLMLAAITGAEVIEAALKAHFHRQRPEAFFGAPSPESYSFPSGHALLSVCLYSLLATMISARLEGRARWLVRCGAAALIVAIGLSRVYLGVHYPSDVIGGYLAGVAWIATLLAIPGLRE